MIFCMSIELPNVIFGPVATGQSLPPDIYQSYGYHFETERLLYNKCE